MRRFLLIFFGLGLPIAIAGFITEPDFWTTTALLLVILNLILWGFFPPKGDNYREEK